MGPVFNDDFTWKNAHARDEQVVERNLDAECEQIAGDAEHYLPGTG